MTDLRTTATEAVRDLPEVMGLLALNLPMTLTDAQMARLLEPATMRLEALARDMRAAIEDAKKPKLEIVK